MSDCQDRQEYLVCKNHGQEQAEQICGECGKPICSRCSNILIDLSLVHYEEASFRSIIATVAGIIFIAVLPRRVWLSLVELAGKPLFLRGPLRWALIFFVISLILTLWLGNQSDGSRSLFERKRNKRLVCDKCYDSKRLHRAIVVGVAVVAGLIFFYELYSSVSSLTFTGFWIAGIAGGLYVLRYEIATAILPFMK